MFSVFFLVFTFTCSISLATLTIRRKRGEDWYNPISNDEKMIESIINISIILVLLSTLSKYLVSNLKLFIILIGIIVFVTIVFVILNISKNKKGLNQSDSNEEKMTLKDLLTRFITVFNVLYLLLSILHIYILAKYSSNSFNLFGDLDTTIRPIFKSNSTIVVAFTILIWTSIVGAATSLYGWTFSNEVDKLNRQEKVNHEFFVKRVMSRNKKSK